MAMLRSGIADHLMLLSLSLRLQLGRRFWIVPLLTLAWPAFRAMGLLLGWRTQSYNPAEAQNALIGFPMTVIAIGLGIRIIASEIEQRTLEVTYTVPGGAHRVWISKVIAAVILLVIAEVLLAIVTAAFFTAYPISALYGALQGAVVYLVLAMGLGALLRSEITAALVCIVLLAINGFITGFGALATRWSPFFNPLGASNAAPTDVLAWTVQNRIGFALLIIAITALACTRAERREQLLRV